MKLSTFMTSLLLTSTSLFVHAAPTTNKALQVRKDEGWKFEICRLTIPGQCSIYIATSDDDVTDYRTAIFFDYQCKVLQAVRTSKTTPKITLKGPVHHFVDLYVDQGSIPNGHLSYWGKDVLIRPAWDGLDCYKPPNSDGTGCRQTFGCRARPDK